MVVYVRGLLSMSVACNVIVLAVFLDVLTLCEVATGASLTAVTVIVTVATFESTLPSLALKVKLAMPL